MEQGEHDSGRARRGECGRGSGNARVRGGSVVCKDVVKDGVDKWNEDKTQKVDEGNERDELVRSQKALKDTEVVEENGVHKNLGLCNVKSLVQKNAPPLV